MRLSLSHLEDLAPIPYVLFVGMTWGVLLLIPSLLAPAGRPGPVVALIAWLTTGGGAIVLWWASVRRRRFSVWKAALHATLAWALADMVSIAVSLSFAHAAGQIPPDVHLLSRANFVMTFEATLAMSPFRFVAAAALLAFGRLLPGSGRAARASSVAKIDHEAIT